MESYVKVNKKIRQMMCHAPLIPWYIEYRRYKGKGLGRNEKRIEDLLVKRLK